MLLAPLRRWPALAVRAPLGALEILSYWRALRGLALAAGIGADAVLALDAVGRGFAAWIGAAALFLVALREHGDRSTQTWLCRLGWKLLQQRDVQRPTAVLVRLAGCSSIAALALALGAGGPARLLAVATGLFAALVGAFCAARFAALAVRLRRARVVPGIDPRAPALLPGELDGLVVDSSAGPYRGPHTLGRVPLVAGPRRALALAGACAIVTLVAVLAMLRASWR
jgi:hypothetical protein